MPTKDKLLFLGFDFSSKVFGSGVNSGTGRRTEAFPGRCAVFTSSMIGQKDQLLARIWIVD
jgi:hypothetical protein